MLQEGPPCTWYGRFAGKSVQTHLFTQAMQEAQSVHAAREMNNLHLLSAKVFVQTSDTKCTKTGTTHVNGGICTPMHVHNLCASMACKSRKQCTPHVN